MPESDARESMVRFDHVTKAFGDLQVLRGIDIDVARGERITIIGPSGSGKSTILRLLMTLEKPTSGEIVVDGESLWSDAFAGESRRAEERRLQRLRRKIGMVSQHFELFPHLTVLKNLTLAPRKVLGMANDQAVARAEELLEKVGLADKRDVYPGTLSGGQKQRVAIARALALEPQVMCFDEVTSALDPELVGEVLQVVRDLAAQTDMTMLFVTHQMEFAREVSDRILFMDGGVVVERGAPAAVLDEPQEERTQAFLQAVLSSH